MNEQLYEAGRVKKFGLKNWIKELSQWQTLSHKAKKDWLLFSSASISAVSDCNFSDAVANLFYLFLLHFMELVFILFLPFCLEVQLRLCFNLGSSMFNKDGYHFSYNGN